jgi:hypothetical protein
MDNDLNWFRLVTWKLEITNTPQLEGDREVSRPHPPSPLLTGALLLFTLCFAPGACSSCNVGCLSPPQRPGAMVRILASI